MTAKFSKASAEQPTTTRYNPRGMETISYISRSVHSMWSLGIPNFLHLSNKSSGSYHSG